MAECDFCDECEGSLAVAHGALSTIARDVEKRGGCCDGDDAERDIISGVSCLLDTMTEDRNDEKARYESKVLALKARVEVLTKTLGELGEIIVKQHALSNPSPGPGREGKPDWECATHKTFGPHNLRCAYCLGESEPMSLKEAR